MDIAKIIAQLTVGEKAALVSGTDFMYTNPVPRLNISAVRMSDGPHGLRVQKEGGDNGVTQSEQATAFPTAVSTASSWNPDNTYKMGEGMLCGTSEIGKATADKMKDFRLVVWSMHGIYGAGKTLDETFGLIETVEKAAQIYMLTCNRPRLNTIADDQLRALAEFFKVDYRKDFLN